MTIQNFDYYPRLLPLLLYPMPLETSEGYTLCVLLSKERVIYLT